MEKLISAIFAVTGAQGNGKRPTGLALMLGAVALWASGLAGENLSPEGALACGGAVVWGVGAFAAWARRSLW